MKFLLGILLLAAAMPAHANEREIQCLANVIYYEAKSEPAEGQKAVGYVTINRKNSGKFRKTVCEVVSQPGQYSWYPKRNVSDPKIKEIARHIFRNPYNDNTKGSLFFHSWRVNPHWKLTRTIKIGGHIFYK